MKSLSGSPIYYVVLQALEHGPKRRREIDRKVGSLLSTERTRNVIKAMAHSGFIQSAGDMRWAGTAEGFAQLSKLRGLITTRESQ